MADGIAREDRTGLEPWARAELPAPPPTHGFRILGVIGPGVILLGSASGSGEWLIGPAAFVQYGLALLWVTTVAVFFQTVFNTELVRYTLYTCEPAVVRIETLKSGDFQAELADGTLVRGSRRYRAALDGVLATP